MKIFVALLALLSSLVAAPALSADPSSAWQSSVAHLIASKQNYPRSAQIRGEEGTTRLKISLEADGRISHVQLAVSSGSTILDREAQSMVSAIGKFPTPPSGTRSLLVPIVWRLN